MPKTMVNMIMDEAALCRRDGTFDRFDLGGDLYAGLTLLQHLDNGFQMTIRPFEAIDDVSMRCVRALVFHIKYLSPLGGLFQDDFRIDPIGRRI